MRVQLLTPGSGILEGSPEGQKETALEALNSLGVEVVTGARVFVCGGEGGGGRRDGRCTCVCQGRRG